MAPLSSLGTVADLLWRREKYDEAEPLYREALDGFREVLGPRDPNTLSILGNLGVLLEDAGRLAEAEPLVREVVDPIREVHGPRHPQTLTSVHNLAALLKKQGKLEEAETLFRQALDGRREVLGPKHESTILTAGKLYDTLQARGDAAGAAAVAASSTIEPSTFERDCVLRHETVSSSKYFHNHILTPYALAAALGGVFTPTAEIFGTSGTRM